MRLILLLAGSAGLLSTTAVRSHQVSQKDKTFSTTTLSVAKGDEVVFKNDDAVVHNVFSSDAAFKFNLRAQAPGASTAVTFDTPGSFHVRCAIHPSMRLDVTVAP